MKTDKALRRIASMRRSDHQPVAEYVAGLPPDLRNAVLDSLTLPERRALEHLLKARQEKRRVRAIEDEKIHKVHEAATAEQQATREAELASRASGAAPAQEPDRLVGILRPHSYSVRPKIGIK
jgi:hypothetical protein